MKFLLLIVFSLFVVIALLARKGLEWWKLRHPNEYNVVREEADTEAYRQYLEDISAALEGRNLHVPHAATHGTVGRSDGRGADSGDRGTPRSRSGSGSSGGSGGAVELVHLGSRSEKQQQQQEGGGSDVGLDLDLNIGADTDGLPDMGMELTAEEAGYLSYLEGTYDAGTGTHSASVPNGCANGYSNGGGDGVVENPMLAVAREDALDESMITDD